MGDMVSVYQWYQAYPILSSPENSWYGIDVLMIRVAYQYSSTDRNRYSFRKEPVFTRFVENQY